MQFRRRKRWGGKIREARKESFILYSGLVVLVFIIIVIGLSFLSKVSRFQIENISIEGNSITSQKDLFEIVDKNISGLYLRLFLKRNSFIYPKKRITGEILESFKRVAEVDLDVKDLKNLHIKIVERSPDSMWCGEVFSLLDNTCYFLDEEGLIYSLAPKFSGNVFFRNFGEISSPDEPIGQNFLTGSRYQSLKFFRNTLPEYDLTPIALNKLTENDVEIYLEEGGKIIYNLEQDILQISEDLGSILKDNSFKNLFSDNSKELNYIDLRFNNKAYFKFK